jgi:hypothetical protein
MHTPTAIAHLAKSAKASVPREGAVSAGQGQWYGVSSTGHNIHRLEAGPRRCTLDTDTTTILRKATHDAEANEETVSWQLSAVGACARGVAGRHQQRHHCLIQSGQHRGGLHGVPVMQHDARVSNRHLNQTAQPVFHTKVAAERDVACLISSLCEI